MSEINEAELLAGKVRRGEQVTAQEMQTVFKTADAAGVLYYQMLTMVREQRSLSELPETLKKIIKTEAWKGWRWVGSSFGQNSLRAYLTSPPPNGVGIQLDTVRKLIEGDEEAETLYEAEMRDRPGGDRQSKRAKSINNNIINASPPKQGTSRAYTLTRLKRERPDLFEQVKAKKLSANAAAIKAGFRRKPTRFEQIARWLPQLTADERAQLREMLAETGARRPDPSEDCATVDHADNEVKPCR